MSGELQKLVGPNDLNLDLNAKEKRSSVDKWHSMIIATIVIGLVIIGVLSYWLSVNYTDYENNKNSTSIDCASDAAVCPSGRPPTTSANISNSINT